MICVICTSSVHLRRVTVEGHTHPEAVNERSLGPHVVSQNAKIPYSSITGGHIKQDLRYTQKPIYFLFFQQYLVLFNTVPRNSTIVQGHGDAVDGWHQQKLYQIVTLSYQ